MTAIEKKVAESLRKLGVNFLGPEYGKSKAPCIYCGRDETEFRVGRKAFHAGCWLDNNPVAVPLMDVR